MEDPKPTKKEERKGSRVLSRRERAKIAARYAKMKKALAHKPPQRAVELLEKLRKAYPVARRRITDMRAKQLALMAKLERIVGR